MIDSIAFNLAQRAVIHFIRVKCGRKMHVIYAGEDEFERSASDESARRMPTILRKIKAEMGSDRMR